jgi:2-polyprenyl-6-methoxyphenol hydroxylase-like FAD-dependent oxidoreductase
MNPVPSVTIVGAGIAGLAVAIALNQRGINVQVLEQAPELQEIGAGLLLGPNACAVLERLGVLQTLLIERSIAVPRWELRDWQGLLLSALHIPRSGESSISTRRSDLQWALMQRLPREVVKLGCTVTNAELITEGVRLKLADGRQMTANKVIVTDGAHSMVRAALWPGREPLYCGYVGWRGLVDHVPRGWEVGRVSESWGYGRRFGIAPVGGGRTYWYASANVPAARCRDRVSVAELRRDFAHWHHPVTEILSYMSEENLLQHPIHDRRPAWHWQREEKVVLLGDAAHPLTPNLGQGAAMALEDAWELAALWGKPDTMKRFEQRRRMRLLLLWAASRQIGKLIQWDHPALCWLRDTQMRLTPDTLHTAMMRRLLRYVPSEVAML